MYGLEARINNTVLTYAKYRASDHTRTFDKTKEILQQICKILMLNPNPNLDLLLEAFFHITMRGQCLPYPPPNMRDPPNHHFCYFAKY